MQVRLRSTAMNKKRKLALSGVLLTLVSLFAVAPAAAAPPPPGYPTQEVMATVVNPGFASIPIRRGFWDGDAGQGFGMDKAWHYHNITTLSGMVKVMASPNYVKQSNGSWRMTAYVHEKVCVIRNGVKECEITQEIPVIGIYNPRTFDKYFGWPVGGVLGMQTMYCDQGGVIKCPSWVWLALQNLGQASKAAPIPDEGFSIESGLTAEQQADQMEILETPEMRALEEQVMSGEVILGASYEPLSN